MKTEWLGMLLLLAAVGMGCGSDNSQRSASRSGNGSPITYRLTAADQPEVSREGSFLGLKFPPDGPTGLHADVGVAGTLQVVTQDPQSESTILDYQIPGIDLTSDKHGITGDVSAHGTDVGRIQLHRDGSFSMEVHLTILGLSYDLAAYQPRSSQYPLGNGQLLFRGVQLRTSFDEPYFGTPLLFLWADPES